MVGSEDRDSGGGEGRVIKGDPARGRRWIWDKWLFEGNGLWAIARWSGRTRARAEMRENTWWRRKRDALTHLSNHRGSALSCPLPFCPQFVVTFWQLSSLFCTNFMLPVLLWPSRTGGSECIVVENGKAVGAGLRRENTTNENILESTTITEFKQTETLTPEQRRLITSVRPQRVVCLDRGLST